MIKIIESPREGMQGITSVISNISQLLKVGFDTVETGSIVSPRLIPQMADSLDVLKALDLSGTTSNIMMLAVHDRGAQTLAETDAISHIAYPFSFSPTFLRMNVNSSVDQSLKTTELVTNLCQQQGKTAVIYISMAFGNPYGDKWSVELLVEWVSRLYQAGARIIPLSNVSMEISSGLISQVYTTLIPMFPDVEFGLHLHTANVGWYEKIDAAYKAGCRRFDAVINGLGGCPMAGKELLGNLNTENLIEYTVKNNLETNINQGELLKGYRIAGELFSHN
jgi:hydroxymethylglutaryl-CoA lyase